MFPSLGGILLVILFLSLGQTCLAATQWESLKAVKGFADALLDPVQSIKTQGVGIFAEDVQGEIDVLTGHVISGRNVASGFIFGPFARAVESPTIPTLFGAPVSYNVTGLTLQHSTVTASILFELQYAAINQTVPFQIDGWFKVNNDYAISQFSLTFKHWSWAMETLLPALTPAMATMLNLPSNTSSSDILRDYLTAAVCLSATQSCTGSSSQYTSYADCTETLAGKSLGEWDRMADDTLLCRAFASQLVAYDSTEHCPQLGVDGGDLCISRSYAQAVEGTLPLSWNAAKVVTPENADTVSSMLFASGESLDELLHISLSQNEIYGWEPTLYATATFGYFMFMYSFTKALWFLLGRFHRVFASLSRTHQKNVVMYMCQIIFTTIALILELLAAPVFGGTYELWAIKCIRASGITISTLYIFELVFRFDMRLPLVAHHILTVIVIAYGVVMFEWAQDPSFAISGIIWLFQATAEQPTFIGLIGYRLKWNPRVVANILKFASIQTFIIKAASAIGVIVFWAIEQRTSTRPMDLAWTALVFIIGVGLLATQVWGSYVTYVIGLKVEKKARQLQLQPRRNGHNGDDENDEQDPESAMQSTPALPMNHARPEHQRIYSDSSIKHLTASPPFGSPSLGDVAQFGQGGGVEHVKHERPGLRSGMSSMSRLEMELGGGRSPSITWEDEKRGHKSFASII